LATRIVELKARMSLENQNIQLEILKALQKLSETSTGTNNTERFVAMNMTEFTFDPENGGTFQKWFRRYEDLFESVRLLLRKLDAQAHNQYTNYILPKLPKELTFKETVQTLSKIFGSQSSLFSRRYRCLQLVKTEADDIISYAAKVNRACEDSEFHNMKADHFKCLVFICGLKGQTYADIRARLCAHYTAKFG